MKTLNRVTKQVSTTSAIEKGESEEAKIYNTEMHSDAPWHVNERVKEMQLLPKGKKPTEFEIVLFGMQFSEAIKRGEKGDIYQVMNGLHNMFELFRHNPRFEKISETLLQVTEGFEVLLHVNEKAEKI